MIQGRFRADSYKNCKYMAVSISWGVPSVGVLVRAVLYGTGLGPLMLGNSHILFTYAGHDCWHDFGAVTTESILTSEE